MKLRQLLTNKKYKDDWFSPSELLGDAYGICLDLEEDVSRVEAYWLYKWLDTDTYVGMKAFYLDNVLVCVSCKQGRKYPEYYKFIDSIKKDQLLKYLLTLNKSSNIDKDDEWLDLDQEI